MDRIDLHIEVPAAPLRELLDAPAGESTASMRTRCIAARAFAQARQGKPNHALAGLELAQFASLDAVTSQLMQAAALRLGWSARSLHRTLKVARTIADLAGSSVIELAHAAEAMQYRSAGPQPPARAA
jgi:magnesium chelatase family protein